MVKLIERLMSQIERRLLLDLLSLQKRYFDASKYPVPANLVIVRNGIIYKVVLLLL